MRCAQARHPEQVQSKAGDHLIVATSVGSETTEESRVRQRSKAKAAGELRAELLATNKPRAQAMGHKLSYVLCSCPILTPMVVQRVTKRHLPRLECAHEPLHVCSSGVCVHPV